MSDGDEMMNDPAMLSAKAQALLEELRKDNPDLTQDEERYIVSALERNQPIFLRNTFTNDDAILETGQMIDATGNRFV